MRNMKKLNRMLTIILLTIMFTSEVTYVQAARKKVDTTNTYSIAEFTANLLQAMDIDVKKGSYLEKAKEIGLYKTKEINEKNKKITKAEASILVNRADEYLYHDTYKIAKDFLKKVQYTAVPDIGTLGETRRISCSNAFAKGIIPTEVPKLFSNTSKFHPGYVVTKDEANVIISRTVDPTKRFKVTPEGAMCKENNTIERQDKFVSVLASVPDDFYSGKLSFEKNSRWGTKEFGFKEIDNYAYPIDARKVMYHNSYGCQMNLGEMIDQGYDKWSEQITKYVNYIFNVDYNKVMVADSEWYQFFWDYSTENERSDLIVKQVYYTNHMKEAKASIKADQIIIDKDNIYYGTDGIHVRVYVHYMISTELQDTMKIDELRDYLLFCGGSKLNNCKYGEWSEAYFDLCLEDLAYSLGTGKEVGVSVNTKFIDYSLKK